MTANEPISHKLFVRFRWVLWIVAFLSLTIGGAFLWKYTSLAEYLHPSDLYQRLLFLTNSPWGLLGLLIGFLIAGFLVIPINLIFVVVGALYSFPFAVVLSLICAQISALCFFYIGRQINMSRVVEFAPSSIKKWGSGGMKNIGLFELSILRFMPLGPFTTMNLFMGAMRVPPRKFILANFVGLLPGSICLSLVGAGIRNGSQSFDQQSLMIISAGVVGLLALSLFGKWLFKHRANQGLLALEKGYEEFDDQKGTAHRALPFESSDS